MATQPINQSNPRREPIELKAPELFQFTKHGQILDGKLLAIEPVPVKGKAGVEYLFENKDGARMTCLETADLKKKITPAQLNHRLLIRYERDDNSFTKEGQTAMKLFKVLDYGEDAAW
jgi:hypothetical protein